MNPFGNLALALAWLAVVAGGWLGWHLLRQNGRILLRLDELEKRLDEWEFSGGEDEVATAAVEVDRASRFGNRSLANSKIKRNGLKAGTPAPDFRLPRLDARGELSLEELRGRRVLLVFSDPHCGPCNTLAPELEKFHRSQNVLPNAQPLGEAGEPLTRSLPPSDGERVADRPGEGNSSGVTVVMISRGEPKDNRAKVKEHGLTFPIVLQQQWEISRRYAMFATPIAYLINESGVIVKDVAVGNDSIRDLLGSLAVVEHLARATTAGLVAA